MPKNAFALPNGVSQNPPEDAQSPAARAEEPDKITLLDWVKTLFPATQKPDSALRDAIEEYIEEPKHQTSDPITIQERMLFSNILKLRDAKVFDIMIPRADIAAIDIDTPRQELFQLLLEPQYSRFPVYRENLDTILGSVHIKDMISALAQGKDIHLESLLSDIPIVSPSMPLIDLLLVMRRTSRHMLLVVDEYGGIDGLVTIGDVIENIIGEIDDEHDDDDDAPKLQETADGTVLADARVDIPKFEQLYGQILTDKEREESDTLGGLVFSLAGRIPAKGETLTHSSGMTIEILEGSTRKISRLKIRNIPQTSNSL